ncbi:MAG: hypothetical protein QOF02_2417 [Blastocatellia bacterium]|jgi:hypothetical protein|nr:hypothetical protein [Blastocatellia bacterium]
MPTEQTSVADIFRRAQAIKRDNPQASYKEIKTQLVKEYKGATFPPIYNLAIPEQDALAPEEDWSAGLSLMARGIQQEDWPELINGIILSLEQTENYALQRGGGDSKRDQWHDRTVGISEQTDKGVGKWLPADLMALAERQTKK